MARLEETVNDADFIFECVPDDMELKKDVFERKYELFSCKGVFDIFKSGPVA